ncbi:MAG: two-component sensor histidine kinase [Anaerolineaceae bacterium]|nr:MAG: two-component sensor histidine kinase [Anaerolineaceae bacterium]
MDILAAFFETNQAIIYFAYGLVFFIMGLVVALQSRQSSRLELARSLNWLAGFGILHGLNEWGDLFIPLQAMYLAAPLVSLLLVIQLVFLALSFASLFSFGVSLLKPAGKLGWLSAAPTTLFVLWAFVTFFVLTPIYQDQTTWHHVSNALARYFIAFPGGLLAAYSLRKHARQHILPLKVPAIYNAIRVSGVALGAYAFLGGLIPPPTPFWPGSVINADTFQAWIGAPPLAFRALIGLVLAVSTIRALEVFNLETERRVESLERDSIIAEERERLARDLHDGALQKVYTAGLLVRSISRLVEPQSEISLRTERALAALTDAVADLRGNLEALHAGSSAPLEPLVDLLNHVVEDPHYGTMVNITLDTNLPPDSSLSPLRSGHVMGIVNEALANALRHARARNVHIRAMQEGESLNIAIKDDGNGFIPGSSSGYGLQNMRDRARLLNSRLEINAKPGQGSQITLEIPWMD